MVGYLCEGLTPRGSQKLIILVTTEWKLILDTLCLGDFVDVLLINVEF